MRSGGAAHNLYSAGSFRLEARGSSAVPSHRGEVPKAEGASLADSSLWLDQPFVFSPSNG